MYHKTLSKSKITDFAFYPVFLTFCRIVWLLWLLNPAGYSQDSVSVSGKGMYIDLEAGMGKVINDGDFYLGIRMNAGYQFSRMIGIGASISSHMATEEFGSSFSGLSLQYRIRPFDRWKLTMDYGYVLNYRRGTDGYLSEFIRGTYPFFSVHGGWQAGKILTVGIRFTGLPKIKNMECYEVDDFTGECLELITAAYLWPVSGVLLTCGISLY